MHKLSYGEIMRENPDFITLSLETGGPIEIEDFAAFFAGIGSVFDDFVKANHPDIPGEARMYVKEVRHGSVLADLVAQVSGAIDIMDATLIVGGFAGIFNKKIRDLVNGKPIKGASKKHLRDLTLALSAVARGKNGSLGLKHLRYKEGVWTKELDVEFSTRDAVKALDTISNQINDMNDEKHADYSRALMVFTRSDVKNAKVGKPSGDRVVIEEISGKDLALTYASELTEQKLKYEIREAQDNVFKKGFIVDVNVKYANGKPAAYAVTHYHDTIDLPDDSNDDT